MEKHKLKEEAEHTAKEWKEAEEWTTTEVTERIESEERAAWWEGVCKEAEECAAREAREAEERKKVHLRMEEDCVSTNREKIQWEWGEQE